MKLTLGLPCASAGVMATARQVASMPPAISLPSTESLILIVFSYSVGKFDGVARSSARRVEWLAEAGGRSQLHLHLVAGDDHQHEDGGEVGEHGEQLGIDLDAERLTVQLQDGDAAEQVGA